VKSDEIGSKSLIPYASRGTRRYLYLQPVSFFHFSSRHQERSLDNLIRKCSAMAFPATRSALSQETSMRKPEIFAPRSASAWAQQLGVDTFFLPNCKKYPARSTPTFSELSELHSHLIGVEYHSHFIPLPLFIHCIPKPSH
jgi:hypothetical protein